MDAGIVAAHSSGTPSIGFDTQVADGLAALAGEGVALLTSFMWQRELESGNLVRLFPIDSCDLPLWLVHPRHSRNKAKIRRFGEWLLGEVATLAADGPAGVLEPPARA